MCVCVRAFVCVCVCACTVFFCVLTVVLLFQVVYTLVQPRSEETDEMTDIIEGITDVLGDFQKTVETRTRKVLNNTTIHVSVKTAQATWIGFQEGCFPKQFPYGTGSFSTPRPVPITENQKDVLFMEYRDCRFGRHMAFIFFRYMMRQAKQSGNLAFIAAEKSGGQQDDEVPLNREVLEQVRATLLQGKDREQFDAMKEGIISRLKRFSSCMPSSDLHMAQERKDLFSQLSSVDMPSPTFFATFSTADAQWPELFELLTSERFERQPGMHIQSGTFKNHCILSRSAIAPNV